MTAIMKPLLRRAVGRPPKETPIPPHPPYPTPPRPPRWLDRDAIHALERLRLDCVSSAGIAAALSLSAERVAKATAWLDRVWRHALEGDGQVRVHLAAMIHRSQDRAARLNSLEKAAVKPSAKQIQMKLIKAQRDEDRHLCELLARHLELERARGVPMPAGELLDMEVFLQQISLPSSPEVSLEPEIIRAIEEVMEA